MQKKKCALTLTSLKALLIKKLMSMERQGRHLFDLLSKGKDLPWKKLVSYVSKKSEMDLSRCFDNHKKLFPHLSVLAQKESARRLLQVGHNECFFLLSGHVSSPRQTCLSVCSCECLLMLSSIINEVHIDEWWAVKKHPRQAELKHDTDAVIECWNLEHLIEMGKSAPPKT